MRALGIIRQGGIIMPVGLQCEGGNYNASEGNYNVRGGYNASDGNYNARGDYNA